MIEHKAAATVKWVVTTTPTGEQNIKLEPGQVIAAPDSTTFVEYEPHELSVLTPWVIAHGHIMPKVAAHHDLFQMDIQEEDEPDTLPEPNLLLVHLECKEDVMTAIRADEDLFVVWDADNLNQEPTVAEYTDMFTYMALHGISNTDGLALTNSPKGTIRNKIANALKDWLNGA